MMRAITSRCLNNWSSQGKPKEQSEGQKLSLTWAEGLLESVVCRRWRGSTHTSAIWGLWNALPPPDLRSTDLARLKQHFSRLTALRSCLVLRPPSLALGKPWESSYLFYCPQEQGFVWEGSLEQV